MHVVWFCICLFSFVLKNNAYIKKTAPLLAESNIYVGNPHGRGVIDVTSENAFNLALQFTSHVDDEDVYLNVTQLIQRHGYAVEEHYVETSDGYKLTLFRIPSKGPAVFLMHGLLCSADDWITPGPASGLGYLLAAEGYDVWLGNARGNKHSRRHARLGPDSAQFWDFSWDEIGRRDLPAMIDHVLRVTGLPQLLYVGHSQGTTAFFVMCSELPEYNDKISLMVALSAVAWMSHLRSPIIRLLSPLNPYLYEMALLFGINEFAPSNSLLEDLRSAMCDNEISAMIVCSNVAFLLCGFDYDQVNATNLPVLYTHSPGGSSTKQLIHYGQGVVSARFQQYDYGIKGNVERYGSQTPPRYVIERVSAPVAIFYSDNDWLAHIKDVHILSSKLKNVVDLYKIPFENFNHMDYVWGKGVKKLVFSRLIKLFNKFQINIKTRSFT